MVVIATSIIYSNWISNSQAITKVTSGDVYSNGDSV